MISKKDVAEGNVPVFPSRVEFGNVSLYGNFNNLQSRYRLFQNPFTFRGVQGDSRGAMHL